MFVVSADDIAVLPTVACADDSNGVHLAHDRLADFFKLALFQEKDASPFSYLHRNIEGRALHAVTPEFRDFTGCHSWPLIFYHPGQYQSWPDNMGSIPKRNPLSRFGFDHRGGGWRAFVRPPTTVFRDWDATYTFDDGGNKYGSFDPARGPEKFLHAEAWGILASDADDLWTQPSEAWTCCMRGNRNSLGCRERCGLHVCF
jgi:hypothetical protein